MLRGALLVMAVAVGACMATPAGGPVAIRTEAMGPICEAARIGGILVPDANYGLGFQPDGGSEYGAIWPDGYSARREGGKIVLIDPSGHFVAREGDYVVAAGAVNSNGAGRACTDIGAVPSPGH
jgi:hypothetical protein